MDDALLKSMTDDIVDELHPERVILFGSHARGSAHEKSDVDLLVVVPNSQETIQQRRRIEGRLYKRLAYYPVTKDVLVFTLDEIQRWRNVTGHVIESSMREGRQLYVR